MINQEEKKLAIKAIIVAQHDGNCGLSNASYAIKTAKEAIDINPPNIPLALKQLCRALDSIKFTSKSIEGLYPVEKFIKALE